jgi:UDP:flavonoid glycosyltransferase YjiC (YdhE family)
MPEIQDSVPSKAIFAYLAADFPPTNKLLHVLAHSGHTVEAFVRDISNVTKQNLRALNVTVHDTPPNLSQIARRCALIVHHGGIGTIEACMALGRPQVLLPRHLEQRLNALNATQLSVALELKRTFSLAEAAAVISEALHSETLSKSARELAVELTVRPLVSLDQIIAACEELA